MKNGRSLPDGEERNCLKLLSMSSNTRSGRPVLGSVVVAK